MCRLDFDKVSGIDVARHDSRQYPKYSEVLKASRLAYSRGYVPGLASCRSPADSVARRPVAQICEVLGFKAETRTFAVCPLSAVCSRTAMISAWKLSLVNLHPHGYCCYNIVPQTHNTSRTAGNKHPGAAADTWCALRSRAAGTGTPRAPNPSCNTPSTRHLPPTAPARRTCFLLTTQLRTADNQQQSLPQSRTSKFCLHSAATNTELSSCTTAVAAPAPLLPTHSQCPPYPPPC